MLPLCTAAPPTPCCLSHAALLHYCPHTPVPLCTTCYGTDGTDSTISQMCWKKIYILCFVCSIDLKLLVAISSLSCPPHCPCVVVVPFVLTATSSSSSSRCCRALAALFSLSHPSLSHRRWRVVVTVVATSSSMRHCRCRVLLLLTSTSSLSSSSASAPCPFGSPSSCSHRKGVWVISAMLNEPLGSSTGGREHVEAVSGSQGSRRGFGW